MNKKTVRQRDQEKREESIKYRKRLRAAAMVVMLALIISILVLIATIFKQAVENRTPKVRICPAEEWEVDYPVEDPYETEHINEALFRMGYLREDVPLSISDQLALRAESDWYGVPYSLCLGVIEGECSFNAENDDGKCYGLMALNRDYFPDDLESWQVIHYGVECLAGKLEEYGGDVPAALTAYNAGHDTGNRDYAEFVMPLADKWAALGVDHYEEAGE